MGNVARASIVTNMNPFTANVEQKIFVAAAKKQRLEGAGYNNNKNIEYNNKKNNYQKKFDLCCQNISANK